MAVQGVEASFEAYLDAAPVATDQTRAVGHSRSAARTWAAVAAVSTVGVALRMLQVRGIWVDEAISIHQAHMSLPAMLANLRISDNHPPLFFLALWGAVRLFGYGEQAVRVPSLAAGTLMIPALFLAGRALFDRRTGVVAAAFGAVAPLPLWYAQESRPYAMFMLFATLAVWAQVRVIDDGRTRYWVAYGATTIALLYTHYFSLVTIGLQQLAFAAVIWHRSRHGLPVRRLLGGYFITWLAIAIAVAPLAPYVHQQFVHDQVTGTAAGGFNTPSLGSTGLPQNGHPGVYALITNFVWALWGYHADSTMLGIAALWPLLMLLALALLGRGRSVRSAFVVALAVLPVLAMFAVAFANRSLFDVRYFSGAVPMLVLACARTVMTASVRRLPVVLSAAVLGGSLIAGTVDQQLSPNNPRDYNFQSMLATVREDARPGDTLLYAPNYLQDVIQYYAPGIHSVALGPGKPSLPKHGHVFLLGSFLSQGGVAGQFGAAEYAIKHSGRHVIMRRNSHGNIYLWEYQ